MKRSENVAFDGNGNVIGLVDMATGLKSATYDYNAFGETIQSDGVASVANHFRFSTKYTDDETGLNYYGYRFYDPHSGRFLGRDPIEERGGANLYGFTQNNSINRIDSLGLTTIGEILDAFFSNSNQEGLWIMPAGDEYTGRVRNWQPVRGAVERAKEDIKNNCATWKEHHHTDPSWKPGRTTRPDVDPNSFPQEVRSPPGTDPWTAALAYFVYRITFRTQQIDSLWTSAIGSFSIYITVDDIDCCTKKAKLNIWMYNNMDRHSFGDPGEAGQNGVTGEARQYMWWNWNEETNWK